MRILTCVILTLMLSGCYAHNHGGAVRVDGVGSASWDGPHKGGKGCPPGLAKQGRCH